LSKNSFGEILLGSDPEMTLSWRLDPRRQAGQRLHVLISWHLMGQCTVNNSMNHNLYEMDNGTADGTMLI